MATPSSLPPPQPTPPNQDNSGHFVNDQAGSSQQPQFPQNLQSFPNSNGLSLPGNANLASLANNAGENSQQLMQARMALASQALQNMGQGTPTGTPNGADGERIASGGPMTLSGAAGLLSSMAGPNKEQILKQLNALQQSGQQRARATPQGINQIQLPQVNGVSSPAIQTGSPAHPPSASTPQNPPIPLSDGIPQASTPVTATANGANGNPLPQLSQQHKDFLLAQQKKLRESQQPMSTSLPPSAIPQQPPRPSSATPPTGPSGHSATIRPAVRPPPTYQDQKRNFITSLAAFYKGSNLPLPQEVFNGERDGSVKVAGVWVELLDLFMTVMRAQGIVNALKNPPESPMWQTFLSAKGIPNPLPEPTVMPKPPGQPDPSAPSNLTTNPVQLLVGVYITYLQGFEQHMQKQRAASQNTKAAAAAAAASSPATAIAPSPAAVVAASPANPIAPGSASTPGSTSRPGSSRKRTKPAPSPSAVEGIQTPSAEGIPNESDAVKKRKRNSKVIEPVEQPVLSPRRSSTLGAATSIVTPDQPSAPKRARYKVEYRPLHLPYPSLSGWDERAITSTFPKNGLSHPTRSVHELGVVDMEAVLMGLRSRLPRELGYALTVLSMLSMPHPEESVGGLPLTHIPEILEELLDVTEEMVFGEAGYEAWSQRAKVDAPSRLEGLSFVELERLGRDLDIDVPPETDGKAWDRGRSGLNTDVVMTISNLVRNFSMLRDNELLLAREPRLLEFLARVTDVRLVRTSQAQQHRPFSLLEHARLGRDAIVILTSIGYHLDLRATSSDTVLAIFRLVTSFLDSGFEAINTRETAFGPAITLRELPPTLILSVFRALEALQKISATDSNREVLSSLVPASELVALFDSLVKMFPITSRANEAMNTIEDHLAFAECLALTIYSLAFLAPLSTRATMRAMPGAVALMMRMITDTMTKFQDFKQNPYGVLCRRLCEILGVLNGTVSCTGEAAGSSLMSFSANSGDGKGWRWASGVVTKGWLAGEGDRIGECLATKGLDVQAFSELDKLWWGEERV